MSRNGSGGYNLPTGNPVVTGTTISSTVMNNTLSDIGNEIANSLCKDGQTVPTANLPMGGNRHTGVGNAVARSDYASAGQVQDNVFSSGTVGGTASAITLSCAPAPSAYATNMAFDFKATATSTGATTINVNSLGAKSIYRGGTTDIFAGDIVSGQTYRVVYDGTGFQLQNPSSSQTQVAGAFKGLSVSSTGLSASISVAADALTLTDGSYYRTVTSVSQTCSTAVSGAGGLDAGSIASSTWYSLWVIGKTDGTISTLLSTSATAPTMPSGYTLKARIGWIRTDGTVNKYPLGFTQKGNRVRYLIASGTNVTAAPTIASGASGTPGTTLTSTSVSTYVPSTASNIVGMLYMVSAGNQTMAVQISPNSTASYTGCGGAFLTQSINTSYANQGIQFNLLLESTNVYYAGSPGAGSCGASCLGWEDNL